MMTADLHQFTIRTRTYTRKRRGHNVKTWTVEAHDATDACNQAEFLHTVAMSAPNGGVFSGEVDCTVVDVDGHGAPVDCPHDRDRLWDGFRWRWDGGRDCKACASTSAVVR